LYQIGMAETSTLSEIRVMERAVCPSSPVSPNKGLNAILGLFVGLLFGVGVAVVMEYLDDTVRKGEDVKQFSPIPLIGMVPAFGEEKVTLISTKDPNDPLHESYRKIRNFFAMQANPINTLLVTSAGPGEGKSTTVANLGISVVREGKKVALLDMDLRRARLHTYFDLPNDLGLTDVLQGKKSVDETIQTTWVEGLSVISSGPPFTDPGQLIESNQMGRLISDLKTRFDMVILDSAPVLIKSDALVLGKYVDASIVVLESERTTRRAVRGLMEIMAKVNIRPLGFILNRFPIERKKYFYEQCYYDGRWSGDFTTSESSA
jgi:succinoglycan biosynthesis transport protein ExoP